MLYLPIESNEAIEKTLSKMEISVKSNKAKRTYTIAYNGGKFRTAQLSKPEFDELDFNTDNDWYNYLRNNQVTKIK